MVLSFSPPQFSTEKVLGQYWLNIDCGMKTWVVCLLLTGFCFHLRCSWEREMFGSYTQGSSVSPSHTIESCLNHLLLLSLSKWNDFCVLRALYCE